VPRLLDTIFNKYAVHWQFSLDKKNNLYFGGDLRGKENSGGIYFSKYQEGKYLEPVLIFKNIELNEAVFGPAISPMGDYILFARIHPRGSTNPRIFSIYISFRKSEYAWTEPKELGEKLKMDGNQPRISPDGRYIFFIGNDGMSYWVDAKIIDEFRPKD
jgi:Tol biopolymer transport system component